jgi:hypothetical protein
MASRLAEGEGGAGYSARDKLCREMLRMSCRSCSTFAVLQLGALYAVVSEHCAPARDMSALGLAGSLRPFAGARCQCFATFIKYTS